MRAFGFAPRSSSVRISCSIRSRSTLCSPLRLYSMSRISTAAHKRRPAPEVRALIVGAVLNQEIGDIRLVIGDRHQQRSDFVGVRRIHVCARSDQHPGDFGTAISRRVQKRRHSSRRGFLISAIRPAAADDAKPMRSAARTRRTTSGRLANSRGGIHVRTMIQEEPDGSLVIRSHGDHERGLLSSVIPRIHLSAGVEQEADDLRLRPAYGDHQGVTPVTSVRFGFAPAAMSLRTISTLALAHARARGVMPWGSAAFTSAFAWIKSETDFEIFGSNGPVQRRGAIRQFCIRVFGSRADQGDGRGSFAVPRGCGNLRIRCDSRHQSGRKEPGQQESGELPFHRSLSIRPGASDAQESYQPTGINISPARFDRTRGKKVESALRVEEEFR